MQQGITPNSWKAYFNDQVTILIFSCSKNFSFLLSVSKFFVSVVCVFSFKGVNFCMSYLQPPFILSSTPYSHGRWGHSTPIFSPFDTLSLYHSPQLWCCVFPRLCIQFHLSSIGCEYFVLLLSPLGKPFLSTFLTLTLSFLVKLVSFTTLPVSSTHNML